MMLTLGTPGVTMMTGGGTTTGGRGGARLTANGPNGPTFMQSPSALHTVALGVMAEGLDSPTGTVVDRVKLAAELEYEL
jgi:hypothetical protein